MGNLVLVSSIFPKRDRAKEYGDFRVITSHGFSEFRIKLMWLYALECKYKACYVILWVALAAHKVGESNSADEVLLTNKETP